MGAAAAAGRAAAGAAAGAAAADAAPGVAPVGGNEGNLIVGEAVGLGGKAIRTVSFFGCTFAASGTGGVAPGGGLGVGSAIKLICEHNVWVGKNSVKSLMPSKGARPLTEREF